MLRSLHQRLCPWPCLYPAAVNVTRPVLNQLALYQGRNQLELRIITMDPLSGSHLQAQSNSSLIPNPAPLLSHLGFPQQVPWGLAEICSSTSLFLEDGPGGERSQVLYSGIIIQTSAHFMKSFKLTTNYQRYADALGEILQLSVEHPGLLPLGRRCLAADMSMVPSDSRAQPKNQPESLFFP